MDIKASLYKLCEEFVREKESITLHIIEANRTALDQEGKSSAGDKHETGRAMLHLEMEKASQQLQVIEHMQQVMERIQFNVISDQIKLGSLVTTDKQMYYLSISAGQLEVEGKLYYAVSTQSPIGKLMLGKKAGQSVVFGSNTINILAVL